MKKFISYIALSFAIVFITSSTYFYLLNAGLRNQQNDNFGKLNTIITGGKNYDCLIIGSSRAYVQIDPRVLETDLGLNTYNSGMDGIGIIECNMILNAYLESHEKPQLILLNIDFTMFNTEKEIFDYPQYFPFASYNVVKNHLTPYCSEMEWVNFLPFIGPSYYSEYKKNLALQGLFLPNKESSIKLYNGYLPMNKKWSETADIKLETKIALNNVDEGIVLLEQFITRCQDQEIPLVLLYAPQYDGLSSQISNFEKIMNLVKEVAQKKGVRFERFDNIDICKDKKYFYDPTHLNADGSLVYSKALTGRIQSLLY